MISDLEYNSFELMAAAGARELKDGEIVCVGLGLPIVSSFLAKRTHAPNITILLELGVVDPEPIEIGVDGLSDPRIWYRAKAHTSFADMLGSVLHRGLVDVGFLGALEVDALADHVAVRVVDAGVLIAAGCELGDQAVPVISAAFIQGRSSTGFESEGIST